jgi:hypothetical protein
MSLIFLSHCPSINHLSKLKTLASFPAPVVVLPHMSDLLSPSRILSAIITDQDTFLSQLDSHKSLPVGPLFLPFLIYSPDYCLSDHSKIQLN